MKPKIIEYALGDDPATARLYYGQSVMETLAQLPAESVQTCATSPPYYGLRDYGGDPLIWGGDPEHEHEWAEHIQPAADGTRTLEGNSAMRAGNQGTSSATMKPKVSAFCSCGAWRGQLGLEPTPDLFVEHIVLVFREVRRVLRKDGTLWLNLGDSYVSSPRGNKSPGGGNLTNSNIGSAVEDARWSGGKSLDKSKIAGLKQKDLVGIPWMVAFALRADGWYLRSDIIWHKPSCMPESTRDRPTKSHEYVFLMSKSKRYFYDQDAIREPYSDMTLGSNSAKRRQQIADQNFTGEDTGRNEGMDKGEKGGTGAWTLKIDPAKGRNKRSVWSISPKPYPGAHFAVWPEELVEHMVKAGSGEKGCCSKCGAPLKRQTRRVGGASTKAAREVATQGNRARGLGGGTESKGFAAVINSPVQYGSAIEGSRGVHYETLGWEPTCECDADVAHCTVLDPFSGSATTGAVAMRLGRDYIGIDLNADYLPLAEARLTGRRPPALDPDEDNAIMDLFGS